MKCQTSISLGRTPLLLLHAFVGNISSVKNCSPIYSILWCTTIGVSNYQFSHNVFLFSGNSSIINFKRGCTNLDLKELINGIFSIENPWRKLNCKVVFTKEYQLQKLNLWETTIWLYFRYHHQVVRVYTRNGGK